MARRRYSGFGEFPAYVPAAERKANAARALAKLTKGGYVPQPVVIEGRHIATTAWGKAWCANLEAYSDYASRLPRGRTYVRNGSVIDLQIAPGKVSARVMGTSLYTVDIEVTRANAARWKRLMRECSGKIDSLVELLRGSISSAIMQVMTAPESGLFPSPKEIRLDCSCPDGANMCKHVAAVLYGVGARLDHAPELLFRLRNVNPGDLVASTAKATVVKAPSHAKVMSTSELADVFGIEIDS